MKKLGIAIGIIVGGAVIILLYLRSSSAHERASARGQASSSEARATGRTRGSSSPVAGSLKGRRTSNANEVRDEYTTHADKLERYRELASNSPVDVKESGELSARLAILDPVMKYRDEMHCRRQYQDWEAGTRCDYEMVVVVEPGVDQHDGEIAYAAPKFADGVAPGPGCTDFARCMARTKIGRKIDGLAAATAMPLSVKSSFKARKDMECDPEKIRELIEVLEADSEAAASVGLSDEPDIEFRQAFQQRVIALWKLRLEDNSCG